MKILFYTVELGKGGTERVINILANRFIENNQVKIITNINTKNSYNFNPNIKITSIDNKNYKNNIFSKIISKLSIKKLFKLKNEINDFSPDVIISFLQEPNFRVLFLKKVYKKIKDIPIIVSDRCDPNLKYKNIAMYLIMKMLYPSANMLVLQTPDMKKYFDKKITVNSCIIPNPVANEFLIDRYTGIREKNIVAVGRLIPLKNYKLLIDAFKIAIENHKDYNLQIFGEGYLREELQQYINQNNLNDNVFLMGNKDDIKKYTYRASAYVLSSNHEGMPNALLEAFCLGIPCISTDCSCGGPRYIINNNENGILVPVGDKEQLSIAIKSIIESKDFSEKLSKNASDSKYKFSEETIVYKWNEIINKLIENKRV